ncbi:MAG: type II toxin-antitoxin system VapC family toxin [Candidatus Aenigmarchaeota archaeon]|nr:type II toxin-antitoxin system VapC family toxin [Candidatus Aenigmarchaeota archaeon]
MKILDTDILVGVLRKNDEAIKKYEQIRDVEITTTIFNAQELLFGALISDNAYENFRAAKGLVNELGALKYDEKSMVESVRIQVYLEKTGRHIGLVDEMTAGICLAHNAPIVTRNTVHFSRVSGLKVEKW